MLPNPGTETAESDILISKGAKPELEKTGGVFRDPLPV